MFSFLRKKRKYLFIVENTSDLNFSIINRISKNHTAFIYIYDSWFKNYSEINGCKIVTEDEITNDNFYACILLCEKNNEEKYRSFAQNKGIKDWKIISKKVIDYPEFAIEKYRQLKRNVPTIISSNCWGAITYNSLSLKFMSPTILMYFNPKEYVKFCRDFKYYIEKPIELCYMKFEQNLKREFPVCCCGDIKLYFNHYTSFEEVNNAWIRRKKRINFNNLLFMHYSEDKTICNEFLNLPCDKILFSPFEINNSSAFCVSYRDIYKGKKFWEIINDYAFRRVIGYDVIELLLNKKIKKIAQYN